MDTSGHFQTVIVYRWEGEGTGVAKTCCTRNIEPCVVIEHMQEQNHQIVVAADYFWCVECSCDW